METKKKKKTLRKLTKLDMKSVTILQLNRLVSN
jgi:hypothetical protein